MSRLDRLLRPKSIAAIGGGFAANVVAQARKMDFPGALWPVHPSRAEVAGVSAYASLDALPGAPDAAFVGVNRSLSVDVVRALRECGAGGAICFASGFAETAGYDAEGPRLQAALLEAAGDMPIVGPNCYGFVNYADRVPLWPDQHGGRALKAGERGAAIVTQSSNIAINLSMQRRGLPLAYILTVGNQAQTGLSELATALIEDDRVSCLGLHVEGLDSIAAFERLAERARALRKPIVALKVGRTEAAKAGALTHTASLNASDATTGAFLKRLGVARVATLPAFLETLKLLHVQGPLAGRRLSSMSCSGGEASLIADRALGRNIAFAPLDDVHKARVSATLGPLVAVANPLDYHTYIWNDLARMRATFAAMASGGFDLNLLVLDFPRRDRCADADWATTLAAFDAALDGEGARGAVVASMSENMPEDVAETLIAKGVTPFAGLDEALDAAEAAADIGAAWARPAPAPIASPPPLGPRRSVIDEATAKDRLRTFGLSAPAGRRVNGAGAAAEAAEALGFPVALKALGVAHKTEAGAVRLGLADRDAVARAARDLAPLGSRLYVERMVEGGVAELIIGFAQDPPFGPVMTLGAGGVLVELLRDVATLLLPTTREDIDRALRGLACFPLLSGHRGRPRADVAAAVEAALRLAACVEASGGAIEELDVNPLIVCGEGRGAFVADALIVERA